VRILEIFLSTYTKNGHLCLQ